MKTYKDHPIYATLKWAKENSYYVRRIPQDPGAELNISCFVNYRWVNDTTIKFSSIELTDNKPTCFECPIDWFIFYMATQKGQPLTTYWTEDEEYSWLEHNVIDRLDNLFMRIQCRPLTLQIQESFISTDSNHYLVSTYYYNRKLDTYSFALGRYGKDNQIKITFSIPQLPTVVIEEYDNHQVLFTGDIAGALYWLKNVYYYEEREEEDFMLI